MSNMLARTLFIILSPLLFICHMITEIAADAITEECPTCTFKKLRDRACNYCG